MFGRIMTSLLSLFGDQVWSKKTCMAAKVIKGGLVMINFMCQVDWPWVPKLSLDVLVRVWVGIIRSIGSVFLENLVLVHSQDQLYTSQYAFVSPILLMLSSGTFIMYFLLTF